MTLLLREILREVILYLDDPVFIFCIALITLCVLIAGGAVLIDQAIKRRNSR